MEPMDLVRRLAAGQDGVVAAHQARFAGLTGDRVRNLCRSGRWRRLARGVYLVDERPVSRGALIRAAVMSLGPGAVAVLGTAAELHGIAGLKATDEIHVSVPVGDPRAQRCPAARGSWSTS